MLTLAAIECADLLREALDSLEYVNRNFPETGGGFVRAERIAAIKLALKKVIVTDDTARLDHLQERYRLSIFPALWGTDAGCRYDGENLRELIDIDIRERKKGLVKVA